DAVRARQQQAKAAFLPHVSANASYQRQPPSISSTRETQGWSVQVGQTLFDAAKFAQYRQSRFDTQAAEQRFDAAREELLLKVAESYFNVLLSRDTVAAHAAEKEAYAQQVRQAQALFNKG
ncbi:TolC family protein, partial [Neisseria gonorrhoeae]